MGLKKGYIIGMTLAGLGAGLIYKFINSKDKEVAISVSEFEGENKTANSLDYQYNICTDSDEKSSNDDQFNNKVIETEDSNWDGIHYGFYDCDSNKSNIKEEEEDDDYLEELYSWDDVEEDKNVDEECFCQGQEIPDGYVELYDGSMARLSDVEDLDDLADPTDYYR